jgi:hypothetical protein
MTSKNLTLAAAFAAATLTLFGCGGAGSTADQATATVGSAGATLRTGQATLSIPAGALASDTQVTIREGEPSAGRVARFELEPHDLPLAKPAQLAVRIDDGNAKVKMIRIENEVEHLGEVEIEDRNHHVFKTHMSKLGEVEVELEHGRVCETACSASEECDDGMCKPHEENEHAQFCSSVCDAGLECDDGLCKPHGGLADPPAAPGAVTCNPGCAAGLECDASDGVCKPHGGNA